MRKIITIDGPSGVGKGTLCQLLAKELGFAYLDSGALYRLAALEIAKHGLETASLAEQTSAVSAMKVAFYPTEHGIDIHLNDEKIGEELRLESTGNLASQLATKPEIRNALLDLQRNFGTDNNLIADGRDMGTVVFPNANLKIFLDAESKIRAERRYKQLKAKGENVTLRDLEIEIAERDDRDRNREIAPLKPASDAVVIDTTNLTVSEVLQKVKDLIATHFF